ncbi:MAG TPA: hypothetical protein VLM89_14155, partial [Phycisphaerae bacterium]|nr:hypothetical protein [Phycisphaerae bacterium]
MIWHCRAAVLAHLFLAGVVVADARSRPAAGPSGVDLPPPGFIDEAAFREALRSFGLDDWARQYAADSSPADDIDVALRRRETLLARLDEPTLPFYERRAIVSEAGSILADLIEAHPGHPSSLSWSFEQARDLLDRSDPNGFKAVLLYELPGRDVAEVERLSAEAIDLLQDLRRRIAATWIRAE